MKPSIIKRKVPVCLLHPWDRERIKRTLHRRATVRFRAGVALLLTSCAQFLANAPLWVVEAALVALMVAAWLLGRAWFLASTAGKYERP